VRATGTGAPVLGAYDGLAFGPSRGQAVTFSSRVSDRAGPEKRRVIEGTRLKPREFLLAAERWAGDRISDQICARHRRRLRRVGWEEALDPPSGGWADGDFPVRGGNEVEVLIDGADALPAIADELRQATSHVHVTGWYFSPDFQLERDPDHCVLRNLLANLAERVPVRVLSWAGPPLPLFRPSRNDVREMRDRLTAGTKIDCRLDARERPLHCHHEKTIVVDDRVAFVGGIDLTSESGDRFDTQEHPSRATVGWHDVSARISGPAVADVAEHFRMRWQDVAGEALPAPVVPPGVGGVDLQVARTVPEGLYDAAPRGVFTILESYLRALRAARRLIYIENQFLWSPEVAAVLAGLLRTHPNPDFRVLLLLPSKPNNGADDTRGVLGDLIEADAHAGRLLACTIYARAGLLVDPIYVHAKVAVVDDAWLTIGSANLNEHSLFNDSEMNVVSHDPHLAAHTRLRLWAEHLELPIERIPTDPTRAIDELWKPISQEQYDRRTAGAPLTHRFSRLQHVSRRTDRVLGPFNGLFVDG
jgi:phosphatidylserine/phosphatidylglycerophosphate/cardiolipin synthase-like enzyme